MYAFVSLQKRIASSLYEISSHGHTRLHFYIYDAPRSSNRSNVIGSIALEHESILMSVALPQAAITAARTLWSNGLVILFTKMCGCPSG